MEYIIGLILALVGFGYYQYNKRNEAETNVKLAETKGKDSILVQDQLNVEKEISNIDEGIAKLNEQRKQQLADNKAMSLTDRAKAARDRFGK